MKDVEKHINNLIFNTNQSLLVSGIGSNDFSCKVVIPADIENANLAIVGTTTPLWLIEVELIAKKHEVALLVIDKIDTIDTHSQLKFLGLIKHKCLTGFKLPDNCRIIVTCNNLDNINSKIKSNCFVIKADEL